MSVKESKLSPKRITFFNAVRENTGANMLDSGGAYGRAHERKPVRRRDPAIRLERWNESVSANLSTAHYLDANFEIVRDVQADFMRWSKQHDDLSWREAVAQYLTERGYSPEGSGNTYNGECDLTQVIQYEVWQHDTCKIIDRGLYSDEKTLTVIEVHCGCDVRGGYGRPIFCRSTEDYAFPCDTVVGYMLIEGTDKDGELLSNDARSALDDRWQVGYSSLPTSEVCGDIEKLHWVRGRKFKATLKTGEIVIVMAYFNGAGGTLG